MDCKTINGYKNYIIYKDGRVWSKNKRGFLKWRKFGSYFGVTLCKNGETKNCYIHRLVANAFIPNPLNLPEVNHVDENKGNNNFQNLEWCTRMQNIHHGTGLKRMGERHSREVLQIKDGVVVARYISASEAHRRTGICAENIRAACKGYGRNLHPGGFEWKYSEVDKCPKK